MLKYNTNQITLFENRLPDCEDFISIDLKHKHLAEREPCNNYKPSLLDCKTDDDIRKWIQSGTIIYSPQPILKNTNNKNSICGIYLITNPKNKQYCGQSITCYGRENNYRRLDNTDAKSASRKQILLYNSIKKYGWDNHKFEIIHKCPRDMLNHWESYYVYLYNTFNGKHGLNLKDGGGAHGRYSQESIEKMRNGQPFSVKVLQYDLSGRFIKIWDNMSFASRELNIFVTNISDVIKNKGQKAGGFIWRKYEDNFPIQLNTVEVRTARKNGKEKPVSQYDLNGIFIRSWDCVIDIEKELGYKTSLICSVCLKKKSNSTAYGYLWRYVADSDLPMMPHTVIKKRREIIQYSLAGVELKRWANWELIEKEHGYFKFAIFNCCRGVSQTAYGFIWRYADENKSVDYTPPKLGKIVIQYDLKGKYIREWRNAIYVQNELGYNQAAISACCRGVTKTAYGYQWAFVGVVVKQVHFDKNPRIKPVNQLDINGNFIKRWDSARQAGNTLGINPSNISSCCLGRLKKTRGEFRWEYAANNLLPENTTLL